MIPLRYLKEFSISTWWPHSTLLRRLQIPTGMKLFSHFGFRSEEFSLTGHLPERSPNFSNLSQTTEIKLCVCRFWQHLRLNGPGGDFHIFAHARNNSPSSPEDYKIFGSLSYQMGSTIRKLTISYPYIKPAQASAKVEECPIFRMLSAMNNLRTLVLVKCSELHFFRALNPGKNRSNLLICPTMEELAIFATCNVDSLVRMEKNRASKGVKFSSITLRDPYWEQWRTKMFELREYGTRVRFADFGDYTI